MAGKDKVQISFFLNADIVEYIDQIAAEYGVKRPAAMAILVKEHQRLTKAESIRDSQEEG